MLLPFAAEGGASPRLVSVPADVDGLRPYQEESAAAGLAGVARGIRNGVLRNFTGSGKTKTGIALVRRWLANGGTRALWVANRTVLIEDAIARLAKGLGVFISREQAQSRASDTRVVVGSVATMKGERLKEMVPDSFGLIIFDECQFWDADGGQAILKQFPGAAVIGLSATPGTGEVLCSHDLLWGIDEGYAVDFVARYERLVELDISGIESAPNAASDKDLRIGELERAILAASKPIAHAVWKHCQDRHPIVYTPGVASAHAVAKILNDIRPGFADSVDAKTPPGQRRQLQDAFNKGDLRCLINCGIYLFGFDAPTCDAIVMSRPTEDWGLWMQMFGRGVRTRIPELLTREERLTAIKASSKPNMLLLDITGQHGKHAIIGPADVDPSLPRDVKARVNKTLKERPEMAATDAIKEAKAWKRGEYDRIARAAVLTKIKTEGGTFDPRHAAGITEGYSQYAPAWTREPASAGQRFWLASQKLPVDISKGEASKLRAQADKWLAEGKATYSQRMELSRLGLPHDLPWHQAADLLYACPQGWENGKRVRRAPSRQVVERVLMDSQPREIAK